jgi:hypothetical protein
VCTTFLKKPCESTMTSCSRVGTSWRSRRHGHGCGSLQHAGRRYVAACTGHGAGTGGGGGRRWSRWRTPQCTHARRAAMPRREPKMSTLPWWRTEPNVKQLDDASARLDGGCCMHAVPEARTTCNGLNM